MLARFLFTTVPGSIFLAAILISTSILVGSGNLRINSSVVQKNGENGIANAVVQGIAAQPQTQQQAQVPVTTVQPLESPVKVKIAGDAVFGDKNAKLTLVEYSDFECPYCKKAFEELLPEFKKDYINTGKMNFVYKNLPLPFHQNAAKEAEAVLCAKDQGGDSAFYKYHDRIFTKTTSGGTGIAIDQLSEIAKDLGLKVTQFQKCLDSSKFKTEVATGVTEAGKVGANGTPTWFIGKTISKDLIEGIKIVGVQPYDNFKQVIDRELSG